jgi:DNA polymerase III epsilon subunit-like protein
MAQLPLFDLNSQKSTSEAVEHAAATRYRRFVFHSEIPEATAHKLLNSFLKTLRKLDPHASATLEDLMSNGPWLEMPFLCVDTETTGLDRRENRVIEIAWVHFQSQKELASSAHLCRHEEPLPAEITSLTGITSEMVKNEKPFADHIPAFLEAFSKAAFIVAYNASFDRLFIESEFARAGLTLPEKHWIDPCVIVREIDKYQKGKRLTDATRRWGVELNDAHRALADAKATGHLLYKLAPHVPAFSLPELIVQQKLWQDAQEQSYRAYAAKKQALQF